MKSLEQLEKENHDSFVKFFDDRHDKLREDAARKFYEQRERMQRKF